MSTEIDVVSGATTESAPEVVEPEVTTPEVKADAEITEQVAEKSAEVVRLERELRKAQRNNARLYREVGAQRKEHKPEQQTDETDPVQLAREIARVERFTDKSNEIWKQGTAADKNFGESLAELAKEVGPFVKPDGSPSVFMDVLLQVSDKPEALMAHLGKNLDLAEELADLTPIQLAKKLGRIEDAMAKTLTHRNSTAPTPLTPVKPAGSDSELGPGLSDAEWMRRREAQVKAARGR